MLGWKNVFKAVYLKKCNNVLYKLLVSKSQSYLFNLFQFRFLKRISF